MIRKNEKKNIKIYFRFFRTIFSKNYHYVAAKKLASLTFIEKKRIVISALGYYSYFV